jgi:hypothetical protein
MAEGMVDRRSSFTRISQESPKRPTRRVGRFVFVSMNAIVGMRLCDRDP